MSDAGVRFATRLFQILPADQNLIFSPGSIRLALAMAAEGARGGPRLAQLPASGARATHGEALPRDLCLSAVVHEAEIDVDEQGTEAAAATAPVAESVGFRPMAPPVVFRADRPFLYAIRDTETGAFLFLGRVVDPTAK